MLPPLPSSQTITHRTHMKPYACRAPVHSPRRADIILDSLACLASSLQRPAELPSPGTPADTARSILSRRGSCSLHGCYSCFGDLGLRQERTEASSYTQSLLEVCPRYFVAPRGAWGHTLVTAGPRC